MTLIAFLENVQAFIFRKRKTTRRRLVFALTFIANLLSIWNAKIVSWGDIGPIYALDYVSKIGLFDTVRLA